MLGINFLNVTSFVVFKVHRQNNLKANQITKRIMFENRFQIFMAIISLLFEDKHYIRVIYCFDMLYTS